MKIGIAKKAKDVLLILAKEGNLKFKKTPRNYFRISGSSPTAWSGIHRRTLLYAIHALYRQGLVSIDEVEKQTEVTLTSAGKKMARDLDDARNVTPRAASWDRKWRLVLFDIPETKKKSREAFRYHLRRLGFTEFQRSSFLYPFPCAREIETLTRDLGLDGYIAMIVADSISNEFRFKQHFNLL